MDLLSTDILPYLAGDKFSNGLVVSIPEQTVVGRLHALTELAVDASVIHFGYCDHLPLVEKKVASGNWLHANLTSQASRCVGLDINGEAVSAIRKRFGVQNGFEYDLYEDELPSSVQNETWDLMVMGEILEHVDDPVCFLSKIRNVFAAHVEKIVITVPNAFDLTSRQFLAANAECINSDHRYWFTPFTLAKVAFRAGLGLQAIQMCDESMSYSRFRRWHLRRKPIEAETIVATFNLR